MSPYAYKLMEHVFGAEINNIAFFCFERFDFCGRPLVVAHSGYSKQGGFELYLDDSSLGLKLWDTLWDAGQDLDVAPGSPNLIERVEGGLLSYGNEFTMANNPIECGLEKYCSTDSELDYIGRQALLSVIEAGPTQQIRGIKFDGDKCPPCANTWPLTVDDNSAGHISTAIWSPRLECNVALGMLNSEYWNHGQAVVVHCADSTVRSGVVVDLPFTA